MSNDDQRRKDAVALLMIVHRQGWAWTLRTLAEILEEVGKPKGAANE